MELINRRPSNNRYQQYINPGREIDAGAMEVHGITNKMLTDKPKFADIAKDFLEFIKGAELIIHNALRHRNPPPCQAPMKIIACIDDPGVIQKILTHLPEKTTTAPANPARPRPAVLK